MRQSALLGLQIYLDLRENNGNTCGKGLHFLQVERLRKLRPWYFDTISINFCQGKILYVSLIVFT